MRKVEFFDTSLRDGEQTPGVNFSIKEKVAIAKQLEKWGVSVIEAGFPAASSKTNCRSYDNNFCYWFGSFSKI